MTEAFLKASWLLLFDITLDTDLNHNAGGSECRRLDDCAVGVGRFKVRRHHLVQDRGVGDIGQKDLDKSNISHGAASGFDHPLEIGEGKFNLGVWVASFNFTDRVKGGQGGVKVAIGHGGPVGGDTEIWKSGGNVLFHCKLSL